MACSGVALFLSSCVLVFLCFWDWFLWVIQCLAFWVQVASGSGLLGSGGFWVWYFWFRWLLGLVSIVEVAFYVLLIMAEEQKGLQDSERGYREREAPAVGISDRVLQCAAWQWFRSLNRFPNPVVLGGIPSLSNPPAHEIHERPLGEASIVLHPTSPAMPVACVVGPVDDAVVDSPHPDAGGNTRAANDAVVDSPHPDGGGKRQRVEDPNPRRPLCVPLEDQQNPEPFRRYPIGWHGAGPVRRRTRSFTWTNYCVKPLDSVEDLDVPIIWLGKFEYLCGFCHSGLWMGETTRIIASNGRRKRGEDNGRTQDSDSSIRKLRMERTKRLLTVRFYDLVEDRMTPWAQRVGSMVVSEVCRSGRSGQLHVLEEGVDGGRRRQAHGVERRSYNSLSLLSSSLCCQGGKIVLPPFHPLPPLIASLLNRSHPMWQSFLGSILTYNSLLSFASLGCQHVRFPGSGPPHFTICGQVHHTFGPLLPYGGRRGSNPSFVQIYFVDTEENRGVLRAQALSRNQNVGRDAFPPTIKIELLEALETEIRRTSPFIRQFQQILQQVPLGPSGPFLTDVRIVIHSDLEVSNTHADGNGNGSHLGGSIEPVAHYPQGAPGCYSLPCGREVAVVYVLPDGPLEGGRFPFDIVVKPVETNPHTSSEDETEVVAISFFNRWLDALSYVVFFPFGDASYTMNMPHRSVEDICEMFGRLSGSSTGDGCHMHNCAGMEGSSGPSRTVSGVGAVGNRFSGDLDESMDQTESATATLEEGRDVAGNIRVCDSSSDVFIPADVEEQDDSKEELFLLEEKVPDDRATTGSGSHRYLRVIGADEEEQDDSKEELFLLEEKVPDDRATTGSGSHRYLAISGNRGTEEPNVREGGPAHYQFEADESNSVSEDPVSGIFRGDVQESDECTGRRGRRHVNLKHDRVTLSEYACFRLMLRCCEPVDASPLGDSPVLFQPVTLPTFHYGGKLFHQWITDYAVRAETNKLTYIATHQQRLRSEFYQGLVDLAYEHDSVHPLNPRFVGRRIVLPSSFPGSPRYHQAMFQDSMALVRQFGKPDLFITMTCNAAWDELREVLQEHCQGTPAYMRPDLTVRVFKQKVDTFVDLVVKEKVLGEILSYTYVVEFQKRGLPHIHCLLMLTEESKPVPDTMGNFVIAELPDPAVHPRLFYLVVTCMVHGPCGLLNPNCSCMRPSDGPNEPARCRFGFPKLYQEASRWRTDGYPLYQRRGADPCFVVQESFLESPVQVLFGGGQSYGIIYKFSAVGRCAWVHHRRIHKRHQCKEVVRELYSSGSLMDCKQYRLITNADIVPYNPTLLLLYEAHINVELCSSVTAVKYLYKYVHKGDDRLVFSLHPRCRSDPGSSPDIRDEISQYVDGRYLSVSEACWRIFQFPMHGAKPPVQRLAIHVRNQQVVVFSEHGSGHQEELNLADSEAYPSTLLAWFRLNKEDMYARNWFYYDIPKYYTWQVSSHTWKRRTQVLRIYPVGRMVFVPISQGERYYLRMLLCHPFSKGATGFDDLLTWNGIRYSSFKEVCNALQLLEGDGPYHECLDEAAATAMPSSLRILFLTILLNCQPQSVVTLWSEHAYNLCEDFYIRQCRSLHVEVSGPPPISLNEMPGVVPREVSWERLSHRWQDISDGSGDMTRLRAYHRAMEEGLEEMNDLLREYGKGLSDFGLSHSRSHPLFESIYVERQVYNPLEQKERFEEMRGTLNQGQETIFCMVERVLQSVQSYELEGLPRRVRHRHVSVVSEGYDGPTVFFVDGPGGSGKTYLYEALLAYARSLGHVAIAVASSGLAATLLTGGRTAHSTFGIPLQLSSTSVCAVSQQSEKATVLRQAALIVWDEAPMLHRYAFEAVDRLLQDITKCEGFPFGRKCVVLGGDFRQLLPVIKHGVRSDVVDATLCFSYLWNHSRLRIMHLHANQRVNLAYQHIADRGGGGGRGGSVSADPDSLAEAQPQADHAVFESRPSGDLQSDESEESPEWFSSFLLRVGNGETGVEVDGKESEVMSSLHDYGPGQQRMGWSPQSWGDESSEGLWVHLPRSIVLGHSSDADTGRERLIDFVFPDVTTRFDDPSYSLCTRVLVSPRNQAVHELNTAVSRRLPSSCRTYISISVDKVVDCPTAYIVSFGILA